MTNTTQEKIEEKFWSLKSKKDLTILSFETSCDETSVAVVKNGRTILSNIISTQIPIHERFGGVVPEVASRNHITAISNVTDQALKEADMSFDDIDALAVTYGAGLFGALLVGVNFAKALTFSLRKPLIYVSHIDGHIAANYLSHETLSPPFVCLLTSGGHSAILDVKSYCQHTLLGTTVDDAVGEAFDKVARVLGLTYPGGPKIDKLAKTGSPNIVFKHSNSLANTNNFSFSGIKTAVINYLNTKKQNNEQVVVEDVCASFQKLVCDELAGKAVRVCCDVGEKKLVVAGGVAANSHLKQTLIEKCKEKDIHLFMPEIKLCTDNAAMIGSAAYFLIRDGKNLADLTLTAKSNVQP